MGFVRALGGGRASMVAEKHIKHENLKADGLQGNKDATLRNINDVERHSTRRAASPLGGRLPARLQLRNAHKASARIRDKLWHLILPPPATTAHATFSPR